MKIIQLTQGKTAVVDDEDGDLAAFNWYAHKNKKSCYAARSTGGKKLYLHRVIAARMGLNPKLEVDHEDRDWLNNRRSNLRQATGSQNAANRALTVSNRSGVKGVCWNKKKAKWEAGIKINQKKRHLGLYDDLWLAKVIVEAARELAFGPYACHG